MNTKFLEAFVWVAKLNSFRAAAKKLNVSQATISSRISTLEAEFDCRLFERERNEVTLSQKGVQMLERAEEVLQAELKLRNSMSDESTIRRRIRIGAIESIVHTWLGAFLSELSRVYGSLEFELTVEPTPHLQKLFKQGALDLILQTDPIHEEGVNNSELTSLELCWVCRKDSHLIGREISLQEIAGCELITFTRGSQPHLSVLNMFEEAGFTLGSMHCVTSLAAIAVLVNEGLGVATVPDKAVSALCETHAIARLVTCSAPRPLTLVASWHEQSDCDVNLNVAIIAKSISEQYAG